MKGPLRKVEAAEVDYTYHSTGYGRALIIFLECGHIMSQDGAQHLDYDTEVDHDDANYGAYGWTGPRKRCGDCHRFGPLKEISVV